MYKDIFIEMWKKGQIFLCGLTREEGPKFNKISCGLCHPERSRLYLNEIIKRDFVEPKAKSGSIHKTIIKSFACQILRLRKLRSGWQSAGKWDSYKWQATRSKVQGRRYKLTSWQGYEYTLPTRQNLSTESLSIKFEPALPLYLRQR